MKLKELEGRADFGWQDRDRVEDEETDTPTVGNPWTILPVTGIGDKRRTTGSIQSEKQGPSHDDFSTNDQPADTIELEIVL
jgi:hypothetical protein